MTRRIKRVSSTGVGRSRPAPGSKVATSPNRATKGHGTMRHSNRSSALQHTAIITGLVLAVTAALAATTTFATPPPTTTLTLYTCHFEGNTVKTFNSNDTALSIPYYSNGLYPVTYVGINFVDVWAQGGTQFKCGTSDGCQIHALEVGERDNAVGVYVQLYPGTTVVPANSTGYVLVPRTGIGDGFYWLVSRVNSTAYNCTEYARDYAWR